MILSDVDSTYVRTLIGYGWLWYWPLRDTVADDKALPTPHVLLPHRRELHLPRRVQDVQQTRLRVYHSPLLVRVLSKYNIYEKYRQSAEVMVSGIARCWVLPQWWDHGSQWSCVGHTEGWEQTYPRHHHPAPQYGIWDWGKWTNCITWRLINSNFRNSNSSRGQHINNGNK